MNDEYAIAFDNGGWQVRIRQPDGKVSSTWMMPNLEEALRYIQNATGRPVLLKVLTALMTRR